MSPTLEQIWESSRSNQYSWVLPVTLAAGFLIIVSTGFIKRDALRRTIKIALIGISLFASISASGLEISEKWKIRHEWADDHRSGITDKETNALTRDGANLTLGPVLIGGKYAFITLAIAALLSHLIVKLISNTTARSAVNRSEQNVTTRASTVKPGTNGEVQ